MVTDDFQLAQARGDEGESPKVTLEVSPKCPGFHAFPEVVPELPSKHLCLAPALSPGVVRVVVFQRP